MKQLKITNEKSRDFARDARNQSATKEKENFRERSRRCFRGFDIRKKFSRSP